MNWLWFLIGMNVGLGIAIFLVVTALAFGICIWTQTTPVDSPEDKT